MSRPAAPKPAIRKLISADNAVVDFLVRMKYLDEQRVTPRDVMCLYAIIRKPGMHRHDLSKAIGVNAGVNVLTNVNKMIRWGFIEDRREVSRRLNPSVFHATAEGIAFWESLKP